jgi:hypothetical protein
VLGAGVALLLQRWLLTFALPILIVGLAAHAWGMFEKHRVESSGNIQRARWEKVLYWACWVGLGGLIAYVVASANR